MFYVLGWNGYNLIVMTSRSFDTHEAAEAYANGCARDWKAFVVEVR